MSDNNNMVDLDKLFPPGRLRELQQLNIIMKSQLLRDKTLSKRQFIEQFVIHNSTWDDVNKYSDYNQAYNDGFNAWDEIEKAFEDEK